MAKQKKQKIQLPPIRFTPAGADDEERQANLDLVTPSPGFPHAAILLADAIAKRSELTVLDYTQQYVAVRYKIDGLWHAMPQMDRETGDYMLASLKQMAGMHYQERRARQEGKFEAFFLNRKSKFRVVSQGVKTGERIAIYLNVPRPSLESLDDLGIKPSMKQQLVDVLSGDNGIVLVSALPNEGYTSLWRATLSACDRFMRDYYVVEEQSRQEEEVVNVSQVTYDEKKGENPFTPMPRLLLREPNVVAFTEPTSGRILNQMADLSTQELLVITRIHAKNAVDALLRLLLLKPDVEKLAEQLKVVVSMRVTRKLCEECRVPFVPHPNMLAKLGLPPGRVRQMYKNFEFQPGMLDESGKAIEICQNCSGIGYFERTGIFEVLMVDDLIRQTLVRTPVFAQLASAAKSNGHISMRDMGIVSVASGTTSLEELQRVLKK